MKNDDQSVEVPLPSIQSRVALIVLQAVAVIVGVFAILYGVIWTSWAYQGKMGEFFFDVGYVTDEYPQIVTDADIWQSFSTVTISSHEPLVVPRTLSAVAASLPFLIVIVGCVCVFILARRLSGGRPFSRPAQVLLTILGLMSATAAIAVPWLESAISVRAITELGLPNNNDPNIIVETGAWVVPTYFDLFQDMNWPLFTLGVTLTLVAILWQQAARMQRDQDGLV